MKNLLLWPKMWSLKDGDIFFTRERDRRCKIVYRPRIRRFWNCSLSFSLIYIYFFYSANISDVLNLICNLLPLQNFTISPMFKHSLLKCFIMSNFILYWSICCQGLNLGCQYMNGIHGSCLWEYQGQWTSCMHRYWLGWNSHVVSGSNFFFLEDIGMGWKRNNKIFLVWAVLLAL